MAHKYELELILYERNIDILCVTETWLYSYINDAFVNISTYKVYRGDHGRGGGVCIYVRSNLTVTELNTSMEKQDGIEDIWITVQQCKFPSIIIGCVYRHPKADVTSYAYITDLFNNMILRNKPIFIFGDFNDNILCVGNNNMSKLVKNLKLFQVIDKPTRITPTSASLLDLVITNRKDMIKVCEVEPSPLQTTRLFKQL